MYISKFKGFELLEGNITTFLYGLRQKLDVLSSQAKCAGASFGVVQQWVWPSPLSSGMYKQAYAFVYDDEYVSLSNDVDGI